MALIDIKPGTPFVDFAPPLFCIIVFDPKHKISYLFDYLDTLVVTPPSVAAPYWTIDDYSPSGVPTGYGLTMAVAPDIFHYPPLTADTAALYLAKKALDEITKAKTKKIAPHTKTPISPLGAPGVAPGLGKKKGPFGTVPWESNLGDTLGLGSNMPGSVGPFGGNFGPGSGGPFGPAGMMGGPLGFLPGGMPHSGGGGDSTGGFHAGPGSGGGFGGTGDPSHQWMNPGSGFTFDPSGTPGGGDGPGGNIGASFGGMNPASDDVVDGLFGGAGEQPTEPGGTEPVNAGGSGGPGSGGSGGTTTGGKRPGSERQDGSSGGNSDRGTKGGTEQGGQPPPKKAGERERNRPNPMAENSGFATGIGFLDWQTAKLANARWAQMGGIHTPQTDSPDRSDGGFGNYAGPITRDPGYVDPAGAMSLGGEGSGMEPPTRFAATSWRDFVGRYTQSPSEGGSTLPRTDYIQHGPAGWAGQGGDPHAFHAVAVRFSKS